MRMGNSGSSVHVTSASQLMDGAWLAKWGSAMRATCSEYTDTLATLDHSMRDTESFAHSFETSVK